MFGDVSKVIVGFGDRVHVRVGRVSSRREKKPEVRGRETPRTGGCDAFVVPAPRVETRAGPIAVVPCRFDAFALHARPE